MGVAREEREQYKKYLRGKDLARPKAHGGSSISVSYSENYSSGLSLFFSTGHHLSVREGNFFNLSGNVFCKLILIFTFDYSPSPLSHPRISRNLFPEKLYPSLQLSRYWAV